MRADWGGRGRAHLAPPLLEVRPKFSRRRGSSDRDPPSPNELAGGASVTVCLFFCFRVKRDINQQVMGVEADPLCAKANAPELVSELVLLFVQPGESEPHRPVIALHVFTRPFSPGQPSRLGNDYTPLWLRLASGEGCLRHVRELVQSDGEEARALLNLTAGASVPRG